jgi:Fe-S-cluster containining protein
LDEEIQGLLDKPGIPSAALSVDHRLKLVADPSGEGFICPFLEASSNKCGIYNNHPFECRLYPFLINFRKGKVLLTVDLNCPYVYENINSQAARDYIAYLTDYLNSRPLRLMLKNNPQIIQAYEEVREVAELELPDETE